MSEETRMGSVLRLFIATIFVVLAAPSLSAGERLEPVHLVFDIDWTLTSTIPEDRDFSAYAHDPRFFELEGKHYRLSNGVEDAINRLLEFNDRLGYEYVKISFFSGGTRSRNEALLKKIILDPKSGRSAFDIAEKILSFEDLSDLYPNLPGTSELKFADRYAKNLIAYFRNLERTIAIDDTAQFFHGDQAKSLLWIGETYSDFPTFADAVEEHLVHPDAKYLTFDYSTWIIDQNRVSIAALQIEYALQSEISAAKHGGRTGKIAFRDRVQAIHAKFSKAELFQRLKKIVPERFLRSCSALISHSPIRHP